MIGACGLQFYISSFSIYQVRLKKDGDSERGASSIQIIDQRMELDKMIPEIYLGLREIYDDI